MFLLFHVHGLTKEQIRKRNVKCSVYLPQMYLFSVKKIIMKFIKNREGIFFAVGVRLLKKVLKRKDLFTRLKGEEIGVEQAIERACFFKLNIFPNFFHKKEDKILKIN